jgi:hypothetical protein
MIDFDYRKIHMPTNLVVNWLLRLIRLNIKVMNHDLSLILILIMRMKEFIIY